MKNQKGFSLIELLVVVIIIGIIAAIAIPSLLASRRAAREAAAVSALRTISSAEATQQATAGGGTFYTDMAGLLAGGLIDATLGGGTKGGYLFTMSLNGAAGTAATLFCVTANPSPADATLRTFGIATPGVINVNAAGTNTTCSAAFLPDGTVLN